MQVPLTIRFISEEVKLLDNATSGILLLGRQKVSLQELPNKSEHEGHGAHDHHILPW